MLPERPRLVLRVGFAGRKELTEDETQRLSGQLREVLTTIGHRLAAIAPGVPVSAGSEPAVSTFYAQRPPLLRLITGLCEGADALAAQILERVNIEPDGSAPSDANTCCLQTELAAVLPFTVEDYRASRPNSFLTEFDRQLTECAWVLTLDGLYKKPSPDTALAKIRRARGYRAQSAFLLRHSDLLVAAANPDDPGKAGGTLETVREALAFELPVVFLHTGNGQVYLIEPRGDLISVLAEPPDTTERWKGTLQKWVTLLTADPDNGLTPHDHTQSAERHRGNQVLHELLDLKDSPARSAQRRLVRLRHWVWEKFDKCFASGIKPKSDAPIAPYSAYRKRAGELSRHYGGLYRGAFLLNYLLAIITVTLAAASLALLGGSHTSVGEQFLSVAENTVPRVGGGSEVVKTVPVWLLVTLLVFGIAKLFTVILIAVNTRQANKGEWNSRAVDYRYLAERLRTMYYLARAGSQQPPAAAPPQFASRVVRQSTIDWFFEAIVRSISPADLEIAKPAEVKTEKDDVVSIKKLVHIQPLDVVQSVRDSWIQEQTVYHERNALTMQAVSHTTERMAINLGRLVIVIVICDLLVIGGKLLNWIPTSLDAVARPATPVLVFFSAILPAVVAALNGIRFQSECQRLAERSSVMRVMLHGRKNAQPGQPQGRWELADRLAHRIAASQTSPEDIGSWSHDVLRLTEMIAMDFAQEAAEWSVLYSKEVSEPT